MSGQIFLRYLKKESMVGVLNGFGPKGWPGLLDVMCRRDEGEILKQRAGVAHLV